MADIFISYKRENREWAEALSKALEAQGWTVWWDTRLRAGESFDDVIERELTSANCVIVLWSKESINSLWVRTEAGEGLERDKLVPILIDDVKPPLAFRKIYTANLVGWNKKKEKSKFSKIVEDVSQVLGPPPRVQEAELIEENKKKVTAAKKKSLKEADKVKEKQNKPKTGQDKFALDKAENDKERKHRNKKNRKKNSEEKYSSLTISKLRKNRPDGRRNYITLGAIFAIVSLSSWILLKSSRGSLFVLDRDFILIEAGSFVMGSPEGDEDERPAHQVDIPVPFYLSKYEVTQAQWEAVMGYNPSRFIGPRRPVEGVSWDSVQAFIYKLNQQDTLYDYRLPTEAEWEYAAHSGSKTRYFWGNESAPMNTYAICNYQLHSEHIEVGQRQPNKWGLYDMYGNVWEWTQSKYKPYRYDAHDGREELSGTEERVLRGGSFGNDHYACRSSARLGRDPNFKYYNVGFRLVALPSSR